MEYHPITLAAALKETSQNGNILQAINDLRSKILQNCVRMDYENPQYKNPEAQINEWIQSAVDRLQFRARLLERIAVTNASTMVTLVIGGKSVKKSLSQWIVRKGRHEAGMIGGIGHERQILMSLTDRGLKDGHLNASSGNPTPTKVVRHFDPAARDLWLTQLMEEEASIKQALELVNATTYIIWEDGKTHKEDVKESTITIETVPAASESK